MIGDSALLHIRHSPGSRRTSLTSGWYGGARAGQRHSANARSVPAMAHLLWRIGLR
jgi:hypothetical protein